MKTNVRARVASIASVFALLIALNVMSCDARACLAQSDLFAGFRDDLIEECCLCLAFRGTRYPGASCEQAVSSDGGVIIPGDGGIPFDGGPFEGDDLDDDVDEDEIPCLCEGNSSSCEAALTNGQPIIVTGACVSQGSGFFAAAPCKDACEGVLVFEPITTQ